MWERGVCRGTGGLKGFRELYFLERWGVKVQGGHARGPDAWPLSE